MKKLLILSSQYPFGNKEQFLHNEISILKKEFDLYIIPTDNIKGLNKRQDTEDLEVFNFNRLSWITKVFSILFAFNFIFTLEFYKEIFVILKRKKIIFNIKHLLSFTLKAKYKYNLINRLIKKKFKDKIIIYSYWMYYQALIAIKLKRKLIAKCITRAHGFDLYEYRNIGNYIPYRLLIVKKVDRVYFISNDGLRYLSDKYIQYLHKFTLNRLGTIDLYNGNNQFHDKFTVVSCSWLVPLKRVHLILEALVTITDVEIKWIHFGDGPEKNRIVKLSNKLSSNIEFILKGNIQNEEVLDYYNKNQVDIFINVSETEGIPVSIMEAISFGIPVIATDVGGVSEIVINEYNGYLLSKNFRISNLTELIIRLIKEKNDVLRINARNLWIESYSLHKNVQEFINEINKN